MTVALLGDHSDHTSHRELDALVPGSPYADEAAVLRAITAAREQGIPFLGTCAGMQYAVVELVRNVLGAPASHAESDGEADDNVVAALACSLYGEERLVTPVPGTRFASWVEEPFTGMHYCGYAPTRAAVAALEEAGVVVVSHFQPHVGGSAGRPIHPLVRAFAAAL